MLPLFFRERYAKYYMGKVENYMENFKEETQEIFHRIKCIVQVEGRRMIEQGIKG